MNVSSLSGNSYTTKSSSSNGMSGLASGLDTDALVEAMLSGTQAKIDKQTGLKQQVQWKQEIYRDIISQINSFQSKFFSNTSSTNLMSSAFFNLMNAVTKSQAFKVTATSGAAVGDTKIRVDQLATNTKVTSGQSVSGKLAGNIDTAALQDRINSELTDPREVVFTVDGQDISVDLSEVFVQNGEFTNTTDSQKAQAIASKINQAFTDAGVSYASAEVKDGNLTITSTEKGKTVKISSDSSELGLKAIGLDAGKATVSTGDKLQVTGKMNLKTEFSFDVSLDDSKKTVSIDLTKVLEDGTTDFSVDKFRTELQSELNRAHGKDQIKLAPASAGDTSLEFVVGDGRKVLVGGSANELASLGFKNGQSNKIGMGGELKDLYFKTELQGSRFSFTINGVDFEFTENNTMSEIISKVNSSDAGVRLVYKPLEDKFVMESTNSGAGYDIEMSQSEGNFLNALFGAGDEDAGGLATGNKATSNVLTMNSIGANPQLSDSDFEIAEGKFTMKINGKDYSISIPKNGDTKYTKQEVIDKINAQFEKDFGEDAIVMDSTGNLTINNGAVVEFAKETIDTSDPEVVKKAAQSGNLALAFGFSVQGDSNKATGDMTLAQLGFGSLNGLDPNTTKLEDLNSGDLQFIDGRLILTGNGENISIGSDADMERLFGNKTLNLGAVPTSLEFSDVKGGVNAIVEIDGVLTERSSNNFSVNGLNIELKEVTDTAETISVSRGTDQIVDGIKSFIEEYNNLIEKLNGLIREESDYKDYAPLTDAQKKEMSEREIELWEEKAKTGLMRRDSALETFLQSMRTALYEKPSGGSLAIYDLGIETSSNWKDNGKLVLTADGEAQLRKMVESNPDEVVKLFTDPDEGLGAKLNKICNDTANTSSANPGSLVTIAGMKDKASATNNELYNRLKMIDDKITALKRTYEKEKSRYWRQFNSMESMVSTLNSQSSWLSQQLGSM